jgi:nitrilase
LDAKESVMDENSFKVAAVQAAPVFFDRKKTVEKACRLIDEAAQNGARLIVFPEAFIPGYPDWIWNVPAGEMALNQELYGMLLDQSLSIPGESVEKLCEAAKRAEVYLVMGINERNSEASGGSLSNTLLYISPEGTLLGKHQKLVPTLSERTIWKYGDPGTLEVYDTKLGKLGGLICWENYMPLVRYSLYAEGIELYVAPTYDESTSWQATLRHIGKEGRAFVIGCCMAYKKEDILAQCPILASYYKEAGEWINTGNSMITDPNGNILAGPLHKEEGILYADIDRQILHYAKWNLDVAGHYARPDSFRLTVRKASDPIIQIEDEREWEELEQSKK